MLKHLKPFALNLILLWLAILIYRTTPYYKNFLLNETQTILLAIAITYTILGAIYYYLNPTKQTKGTLILNIIKKTGIKIYKYFATPSSHRKIFQIFRSHRENQRFSRSPSDNKVVAFSQPKTFCFTAPSVVTEKITKKEKTNLLFILVKFFFLPIMLNFALSNLNAIKNQISNPFAFPFIMSLIFLIDTLYFSFGYATESKFLKNKIKSVEPTLLGWIVALVCYPPFNTIITKYTNWFPNIYITSTNTTETFALKIAIIFLFLIYLSATISLGTKCSNLTNRGIVTKGTYSIVRHPAYISKVAVWWLVLIPIMSFPIFFSMTTWTLIYHLRTLTEERHLSHDPEYIKYKQKVKYRYIPRIY